MSAGIDHSISARRRGSLIENLIEYFDQHVAVLINEGVPSDRIADALRITTVRVEILHGEAPGGHCHCLPLRRSRLKEV